MPFAWDSKIFHRWYTKLSAGTLFFPSSFFQTTWSSHVWSVRDSAHCQVHRGLHLLDLKRRRLLLGWRVTCHLAARTVGTSHSHTRGSQAAQRDGFSIVRTLFLFWEKYVKTKMFLWTTWVCCFVISPWKNVLSENSYLIPLHRNN